MNPVIHEKIIGLCEAAIGAALCSMTYWSPMLDGLVQGAHVVAALGGAIIAIHGVWRIARRRRLRRTDLETAE